MQTSHESTGIPALSGEIAIDRERITKGILVRKDPTLQSVSATSSLYNKSNHDHTTNNVPKVSNNKFN